MARFGLFNFQISDFRFQISTKIEIWTGHGSTILARMRKWPPPGVARAERRQDGLTGPVWAQKIWFSLQTFSGVPRIFQISDFSFQISDFSFRAGDLGPLNTQAQNVRKISVFTLLASERCHPFGLSGEKNWRVIVPRYHERRFQISDFRFQISGFRFQISYW